MSSVGVGLVDFCVSSIVLIILMCKYGVAPSWTIVFMPCVLLSLMLASIGMGTLLSALTVAYRDFRYVIPFVVQFGLYVSPVAFSSSIVPMKWRLLYSLNPMVGVIDGFRYCILGRQTTIYWPGAVLSLVVVLAFLWLGIRQFRKTERTFADII